MFSPLYSRRIAGRENWCPLRLSVVAPVGFVLKLYTMIEAMVTWAIVTKQVATRFPNHCCFLTLCIICHHVCLMSIFLLQHFSNSLHFVGLISSVEAQSVYPASNTDCRPTGIQRVRQKGCWKINIALTCNARFEACIIYRVWTCAHNAPGAQHLAEPVTFPGNYLRGRIAPPAIAAATRDMNIWVGKFPVGKKLVMNTMM